MSCSNCEAAQGDYSKRVAQFAEEISFLEARYKLTTERKSVLMQDWLRDQAIKHNLRCQLREAGLEPLI